MLEFKNVYSPVNNKSQRNINVFCNFIIVHLLLIRYLNQFFI